VVWWQQRRRLFFAIAVLSSGAFLAAAELTDAASRAYTDYASRARQAFLARASGNVQADAAERRTLLEERPVVRPGGSGDGIVNAPNGLIHHWSGAVFIRGVTLDQVVRVSRAYAEYPTYFRSVLRAKVLSETGDTIHLQFRMRESAGGLSATLDMTSTVTYTRPDPKHAIAVSSSEEIREVKSPDRPDERHLPVGRDSGYLWRAGSLTRFVEGDGGVYMEMETIGLSRPFPPVLGWMIEPIARRVGRRSVEDSMLEFRDAVLKRAPNEGRSATGL
jgi:hypothetical protein